MIGQLTTWIRAWVQVPVRVHRMERSMTALSEQLNAATERLSTVQADVRVLLDRVTVPTEDAEAQAAADRLSQFVQAWDEETPDADGSENPTEPENPLDR